MFISKYVTKSIICCVFSLLATFFFFAKGYMHSPLRTGNTVRLNFMYDTKIIFLRTECKVMIKICGNNISLIPKFIRTRHKAKLMIQAKEGPCISI